MYLEKIDKINKGASGGYSEAPLWLGRMDKHCFYQCDQQDKTDSATEKD